MPDRAIAVVFHSRCQRLLGTGLDLGAIPQQNLVVSVERDEHVLKLVILQVPDRLLLRVGVSPHGHTEILPLLRAPVLIHVRDLWNVPDADTSLDSRCEQQILAWRLLTVGVEDACRAQQGSCVPPQGHIGL